MPKLLYCLLGAVTVYVRLEYRVYIDTYVYTLLQVLDKVYKLLFKGNLSVAVAVAVPTPSLLLCIELTTIATADYRQTGRQNT